MGGQAGLDRSRINLPLKKRITDEQHAVPGAKFKGIRGLSLQTGGNPKTRADPPAGQNSL
jgi:hypothetical protein